MFQSLGGLREKTAAIKLNGLKFDQFSDARSGYENAGSEFDSPMYEQLERPPLRAIDNYLPSTLFGLSGRYTVAVMAMLGFIISFGIKNNVSTAKTLRKSLNGTEKLDWTVNEDILVDSSFFYGYLITQVPAGFFASFLPATKLFGTSILLTSLFNLFIVTAMSYDSYTYTCIFRFMQGLVDGVAYPACHGIWRYWAPPLERSRLATLAFCGSYAGLVIVFPLGSYLSEYIGWRSPFYCYSMFGICWFFAWLWLVFEKPRKHPTISLDEIKYIEKSLGNVNATAAPTITSTPFKDISQSMPVYAIIVANFCRSWNFYMLLNYQSKYLKQRFDMPLSEAGTLGAIPHLVMALIVPCGGALADYLRKNEIMTTTNVRKLFNCGGFGLEGLFFVILAHATTVPWAIIVLTIGVGFSGFAISGYNVNHLDIAPRYASILMGLSNGIGTLAGIICPIVIDMLTDDKPPSHWSIVFTIGALVHLFGITFYAVFASGQLQPWAEPASCERPPFDPNMHTQETGFNDTKPDQFSDLNTNQPNYGATSHVTNNPFAGAVKEDLIQQNVQPEAHDTYLHGSVEDRIF